MRHSPLINWLAQLLLGFGLAGISLQVAVIFGRYWQVTTACVLVALAGLTIATRAEWIERRRRLVERSRAALALPTQWSVKLDKRLPGGWTAPLAIIRDDGMRFVVDIRGFKSATWSSTPIKGNKGPCLIDAKGKPLRPDPVPALAKGAFAASAAPVLWLPRAANPGTFRHPDTNLVVVTGSPRDLKLALQGARRVTANAMPSRDAEPQVA